MKFSVGLQYFDEPFLACILENRERIRECYFSWGDFPNGRNSRPVEDCYAPWEQQVRQMQVLEQISTAGIALNLLFNATCYGAESQSRSLFCKIGQTVEYVAGHYGLESVTTTSPLIAKFVKENFPQIKTRASVNMEIGTPQGMAYLESYFDGYYMKREFNRDFETIKHLHSWCTNHGKTLHILANSGCLNHCSAHTFHDNLVSHEQQIAKMDNAYEFHGLCRAFLKDPQNHSALIHDTNFIRPEDTEKYAPWFDSMKLATRVHKNPAYVLQTYLRGRYSGDLLQLLEPAHSIYPYVLENGEPMRIVKIGGNYADQ